MAVGFFLKRIFTEESIMTADAVNQLPSPTEAYNHLYGNVHMPVFLQKLASYGIQPTTEEEVHHLLKIAGQLRHVPLEQESQSRFSAAVDALDKLASASPQGQAAQRSASAELLKSASQALAADPTIFNAVLSLELANASLQGNA